MEKEGIGMTVKNGESVNGESVIADGIRNRHKEMKAGAEGGVY